MMHQLTRSKYMYGCKPQCVSDRWQMLNFIMLKQKERGHQLDTRQHPFSDRNWKTTFYQAHMEDLRLRLLGGVVPAGPGP